MPPPSWWISHPPPVMSCGCAHVHEDGLCTCLCWCSHWRCSSSPRPRRLSPPIPGCWAVLWPTAPGFLRWDGGGEASYPLAFRSLNHTQRWQPHEPGLQVRGAGGHRGNGVPVPALPPRGRGRHCTLRAKTGLLRSDQELVSHPFCLRHFLFSLSCLCSSSITLNHPGTTVPRLLFIFRLLRDQLGIRSAQRWSGFFMPAA